MESSKQRSNEEQDLSQSDLSLSSFAEDNKDTNTFIYNVVLNGTGSSIEDAVSPYYPDGEAMADIRHRIVGVMNGIDGPASNSPLHKEYSTAMQIALGKGIDGNIFRAFWDIKAQYKLALLEGKKFQVNLNGWSRGAAAAISVASLMFKDEELFTKEELEKYKDHSLFNNFKNKKLKDVPVNLFGIDPVPGRVPGKTNANEHNLILHENVKDAVIVYAKNERSYGFEAVVPIIENPNETNARYVLMPGHHASSPGNPYWRYGKDAFPNQAPIFLPEPGKIVRWMLFDFLRAHGTTVKDSPYKAKDVPITKGDILKFFEKMLADEKAGTYRRLENEVYTAKKYNRREVYLGPQAWMGTYWTTWLDVALKDEYGRKDADGEYVNSLHEFIVKELKHLQDTDVINFQAFLNFQRQQKALEQAEKQRQQEQKFQEELDGWELMKSSTQDVSKIASVQQPNVGNKDEVSLIEEKDFIVNETTTDKENTVNTSQILDNLAKKMVQDTARATSKRIFDLNTEIQGLELENQVFKKQIELLQNGTLKEKNDEIIKLKLEAEQHNSEVSKLKKEVEQKTKQLKELTVHDSAKEVSKLMAEAEELKNKNKHLSQELQLLQERKQNESREQQEALKKERDLVTEKEQLIKEQDRKIQEQERLLEAAKKEKPVEKPVIPDTQKFEKEIQKLERENRELKEEIDRVKSQAKDDKQLTVSNFTKEMAILEEKIKKLNEEHTLASQRKAEEYKEDLKKEIERTNKETTTKVEKETTAKVQNQILALQQSLQETKLELEKLKKENQELKNRPPVQVVVEKDTISLTEHTRIVKAMDEAAQRQKTQYEQTLFQTKETAQRAQVQHEQTVSKMQEAAQQKQVRFDLEKQRIEQEALEKAEKEIEQRNFQRIVNEVVAEMNKSTLQAKPELHQEFQDYQTNLEQLKKIKPEDPLYAALNPIYVKMVYLQHGLLKETNKKSDPETDRINAIILQHFKTIPLEILNQDIPVDQKLSPKLARKLNVPKKASSNGEDPNKQPLSLKQVEEMLKGRFDELNNELAKSPPISTRTKALMFGVLGAIIGFVVGAVIGGVASFYMGGSLSIPLGILAAVKGFTIGTAIGIGTSGVTTLATGGIAAYHGVFATKKFDREQELKDKVKTDLKIAPSGGS